MTVVVVTGTSTGVGKTITTAALVQRSRQRGDRVRVVKPVQTGVAAGGLTDVEAIARLTGVAGHELVRLDDPLAPDTAARRRGLDLPPVAELASRVDALADGVDVVYVEGAGGVRVRLDRAGGTVLTLGHCLVERGHDVSVVVVTALALGTLNHTELTVDAIRAAGLVAAGLVLGDVPPTLGLAERCNLDELPRVTGLPVLGSIPRGAGDMSPAEFDGGCRDWLAAEV